MNNSLFKNSLNQGAKFFIENRKIVYSVDKINCYNDEPKLYQYIASFLDKNKKTRNYESVASGVSFNKEKALIKLFGETMERYALSTNSRLDIYGSYNTLSKRNLAILDPRSMILFTNKNSYKMKILKEKIHWVKAKSLRNRGEILIPAQLVFVPYIHQDKEALIQFSISTGASAGISLEDALARGIFEAIERDSFMIHYFNKLNSPQINLEKTKDVSLRRILKAIKNYNLELYVIDLKTNLEIYSVAAVILDKTGLGPAVSVGLKAGINQIQNIIGAIEEALMVRYWIRDEFGYLKRDYKQEGEIRIIEQRAKYWYPLKAINHLKFWIDHSKKANLGSYTSKRTSGFRNIVEHLLNEKIEVYYVDLTTEEIEKCGFKVIKVIIPNLQPLYLDERYPYLYSRRLYEAPVLMEYLKKKNKKANLNKIPHPFL